LHVRKYVGPILIVTGVIIALIYGTQWYTGSQSAQSYEPDEQTTPDSGQSPDESEASSEAYETPEEPETIVTSDQITEYEAGEEVAKLYIPAIETKFDVFWTTDDEALDRGVGMYVSEWTVTPDYTGHVVLSGHRDTVFTELGELMEGDVMTLEYAGTKYKYEINDIWITDSDDRTVIVTKEKPVLTLTTCYPFDYVGPASERYIVQARSVAQ
jgi:sortase A